MLASFRVVAQAGVVDVVGHEEQHALLELLVIEGRFGHGANLAVTACSGVEPAKSQRWNRLRRNEALVHAAAHPTRPPVIGFVTKGIGQGFDRQYVSDRETISVQVGV